jgi:hypothetical protein
MSAHYSDIQASHYLLRKFFICISFFLLGLTRAQCVFGYYATVFTGNPFHQPNYLLGHRYINPTNNFNLVALGLHGKNTGSGVRMAIYSDLNGTVGSLVAVTGTAAIGSGSTILNVTTPTIIPAGNYWIMADYEFGGNHVWGGASGTQTINFTSFNFTSIPTSTISWSTYTVSGGDFNYFAIGGIAVSGPTAICSGSNATLVASGANTYSWNTGSANPTIVISPTATSVYTVSGSGSLCASPALFTVTVNTPPTLTVSGSSSVCAGNNATLTASGATSYTWFNTGTSASIIITPTSTGSYSVTGTLNGCFSAAAIAVTVEPAPSVLISGNNTVCAGSIITQSASGTAVSYLWQNNSTANFISLNPVTNTTLTLTGTAVNGCISTAVKTITAIPLPSISVNSGSICSGSAFTLTATGAASFVFVPAGPLVSPVSTTIYTITGTALTGCSNTAFATIIVQPLPTITVNSGSICAGEAFVLTPSGANNYTFAGGSATVTPGTTTSFPVTGLNAQGCINSAISTVTVHSIPIIQAKHTPSVVCAGQTVTLTLAGAQNFWVNDIKSGSTVTLLPLSSQVYAVKGSDVDQCVGSLNYTLYLSDCLNTAYQTAEDPGVFLFPNPANSFMQIKNLTEASLISIIDELGQVIWTKHHTPDELIQTNELVPGFYFLRITNHKGEFSKKFIVWR